MRTAGKIAYANAIVLVLLFLFSFSVKAHHRLAPKKPTFSAAKDISVLKADKTFDLEGDSFETELEEDNDDGAFPIPSIEWFPLYNNRVTGATAPTASPTHLVNSRYLLVTRSLRI